ncbi:MAG: pitrilysin family protein [Thermoplasmata archaeon]|jgi:zinc protease
MTEATDPLRIEYGSEQDGLRVVRQSPPIGAASFSATYIGPAGWGFDPRGREGVARLVNQLVTSAAGRYGRVELARLLDRSGATLARQCDPESAEVTIWGPAAEWEPLLGILADVVLRPRFDPSDVARARRQMRERQLREATQPANRAERELLHAIYPSGHPYRETGLGSRHSLLRLGRSDLERFHRVHYTRRGACLIVTAPARLPSVERAIRSRFDGFAESDGPALTLPPPSPSRTCERLVNLPGRSQVEVRVGGASIARSAPEYPAAFLANEILGARPLLSRLFQRVREKGGLAYHASSDLEAMQLGGYWVAQAGTGADRWRRVVPMLQEEVDRLSADRVRPAELEATRKSVIGEIPLTLESTSEAHELAVDVAYHRLPGDFWITWPERLRSIRPKDVRDAAAVAFDRRSSVTVVSGPIGAH